MRNSGHILHIGLGTVVTLSVRRGLSLEELCARKHNSFENLVAEILFKSIHKRLYPFLPILHIQNFCSIPLYENHLNLA